jgi:inositol-phosphate transport system permease protein
MKGLHDVETIKRRKFTVIVGLALLFASLPLIIVYVVLVLSSFSDRMITGIAFGDIRFTLENWVLFFQGQLTTIAGKVMSVWDILRYIFNTLLVAIGVAGVATLTSTLAGYAFSRMKFAGRSILMQFLILLHAFPGVALIIAVYTLYVYSKASLPPTLWTSYAMFYVIVARAALEVPMSIWIMKGFFDRVPWEVEWSAIVDGASRLRVWREIVLPLVKPGIATVAIFTFLAGWEDLIYVLVFLPPTEKTLATYIESLLAEGSLEVVHLPIVAAAGTFYLLPTVLFFMFTRRYMLQATAGGLKA